MNQPVARDAAYWDRKLAAFFHDPPDKALHLPGHVKRSAKLLNAFGLPFILPETIKRLYGRADSIASGMDRTQVPSFYQNGAVRFTSQPMLTHPSGSNLALRLTLPKKTASVTVTTPAMVVMIKKDMAALAQKFGGQPDQLAASRFLYAHLLLREHLTDNDIGGLGGLWHKMPADTRVPDHSIWQHCSLVSALSTCFMESKSSQASLMVMSLAPVQDFIGRARKLRDFWTGSVLLSWLMFEGLREIIRTLGADHILYPSLSGQALTYWLLEHDHKLGAFIPAYGDTGVASFPNKFVCLVPTGSEAQYAQQVQDAMLIAWTGIGQKVLDLVEAKLKLKKPDGYLHSQFTRQMKTFFTCHWSACPLVAEGKQDAFKQLLPESVWGVPQTFHEDSRKLKLTFPAKGEGAFYQVSHALIQSAHSAGKANLVNSRLDEPGAKCQLHGDLEALRFEKDKRPRPMEAPFWKALRDAWNNTTDFKESERLSAVALVKRLAGMAVKQSEHPLSIFFNNAESFPSTTEVALTDWLDTVEGLGLDKQVNHGNRWRAALAQHVHTMDEGKGEAKEIDDHSEKVEKQCRVVMRAMQEEHNRPVNDSDKYYAILLMDGDKMGALVNGEAIAARWETVLHPELVKRMTLPSFAKGYHDFWQQHFSTSRLLSPALHAAISEALGDFALHTVPGIIKKYRGRLIYAGGDDLCAVLPASSALAAAKELADAYRMGFVTHGQNGTEEISNLWTPSKDRLSIHLGQGDKISISAGVLIVHHKRPLAAAIRQARTLLEKAKKEGGRNAFALELAKRAGGSRFFIAQWDETPATDLAIGGAPGKTTLLDHFHAIAKASAGRDGETLSSSLLHKFGDLQPGLWAVLEKRPDGLPALVIALMRKKQEEENWLRLAESAAAILGRRTLDKNRWRLDYEPLVIARFLGPLMKPAPQQGRTS